ncbi:MAG: 7-cyano-7-deazaguanine synthase QueC [Planctomycetota bacterium]|nr:MAG: 7-cyano-7-deazaguanine synthase QueC [Planctomycetota bacterium]
MVQAVVLLSGGLDSAAVAAWMAREGFQVVALTVDYGQRHRAELEASRRVAVALRVAEHVILPVDLRKVGGSALTAELPVPKAAGPLAPVAADIPVTYVPARNLLFLSLAAGLAEARGAQDIGIGVNALDYSGYPDCRPEFLRAFEEAANLGTRAGAEGRRFRVHAPLVDLRKVEILRLARELGVPVDLTLSCYDPGSAGNPCGRCDACRLRARAEAELDGRKLP